MILREIFDDQHAGGTVFFTPLVYGAVVDRFGEFAGEVGGVDVYGVDTTLGNGSGQLRFAGAGGAVQYEWTVGVLAGVQEPVDGCGGEAVFGAGDEVGIAAVGGRRIGCGGQRNGEYFVLHADPSVSK